DVVGVEAAAATERAGARPGPASTAERPFAAGEAEAVVTSLLGLVAENVVSLLDLLEGRLGLLVAGVAVGVILPGQLAIGLFDVGLARLAGDAQNLVVVARHGSFHGP